MIVRLLLFATAREAAGCRRDEFELETGASLPNLLDAAVVRYGAPFAAVLAVSRVWVNGVDPDPDRAPLRHGDEVAVLPPVSGGAR